MKNRKKLLASLLAFGMILSVSACGDPSAAPVESKTPPSQAVTESKAPAGDENGTASTPAEFDGKVHGPFVMTTCGRRLCHAAHGGRSDRRHLHGRS